MLRRLWGYGRRLWGYEGNYGGYGTEDNPIQLDEVEIDGGYGGYGGNGGGGYNGGWPGWFPPAWPETGGDTGGYAPIGGGYGGYGDYGGGYMTYYDGKYHYKVTANSGEEVDIELGETPNGYSAQDAIEQMLASLGLASSHVDASATIMNLETKGFSIASKAFGFVDVAFNIAEFIEDPNLEDGLQAAGGIALIFLGSNPAIAIVGGGVLFGLELMEAIQGR